MKKIIIPIFAALLLFCGCIQKQETAEIKNITVSVIADTTEDFKIETEKNYLGEALKENELIEGEEGQYGLFITSVNGIKADEKNEEWWCLTKDNESVMTGVDLTPISDGDNFEITLKKGY